MPQLTSLLNVRRPCCSQPAAGCSSVSGQQSTSILATATVPPPTQLSPPFRVHEPVSPDSMTSSVGSCSGFTTPSVTNLSPVPSQEPCEPENMGHFNYHLEEQLDASWAVPDQNSALDRFSYELASSSCIHAANIIRSMRSDVGNELEADLGCHSGTAQDCLVDNSVVFNVMDKYAGPGINM